MKAQEQRILMILRHAKALRETPVPDRERPLAPEGREHLKRMRHYAVNKGLIPDAVLSSDALRARETAELFCQDFIPLPSLLLLRELYDTGGDDVLAIVRAQADHLGCLLIVGHNPAFEGLVAQLCMETGLRNLDFPPGALAVIKVRGSWAELAADTVTAAEIVRPREL